MIESAPNSNLSLSEEGNAKKTKKISKKSVKQICLKQLRNYRTQSQANQYLRVHENSIKCSFNSSSTKSRKILPRKSE